MSQDPRLLPILLDTSRFPQYQVEGFNVLIANLVEKILGEDERYLTAIAVLPDAAIDPFVNHFISDVDPQALPFESASGFVSAKALARMKDEEFECVIVIPESDMRYVRAEGWEFELLSTLVEELLHVKSNVASWKEGDWSTGIRWKDEIYSLCLRFHDEYIVGRTKVPILTSFFPTADESGEPFGLFYGQRLAPLLQTAITQLQEIMTGLEAGSVSLDVFWLRLNRILYRYIFEPLARDAAFRDANTRESSIQHDADEVGFYYQIVKPVWTTVYSELDASYLERRPRRECVEQIANLMLQFLARLGVTFKQADAGRWPLSVNLEIFHSATEELM